MKLLLAADGSAYTQKALDFIIAHRHLLGDERELLIVHAQMPLASGFNVILGFDKAVELHTIEAEKVFKPLKKVLEKHAIKYRCITAIGPIVKEIVDTAKTELVNIIVMGTHGRDWVASAVMGSVAQRVVANSVIPVLLVK